MSDYIDRQYVLDSIEEHKSVAVGCCETTRDISDTVHNMISDIVKIIPSEDVRLVSRGEWKYKIDKRFYYYCSECGAISPREDYNGEPCDCPNFCPNCGSDMREV